VAYIVILAEDTAEITAGKEDRTASAKAYENGFFSEMRSDGTYLQVVGYPAESCLALVTFCPAHAGAKCARVHLVPKLGYRLAESIWIYC